jgi:PPM family protein phosphatase
MIIEYYGLSEIGPVREDNQDSFRLPDGSFPDLPGKLFGIADGMGGYSHGELASTLALDALYRVYYREESPKNINRVLQKGVEAANLAVVNEARRLSVQHMGTTLTALAFSPGHPNHHNRLHLAHIGDSRAYLIRDGSAICLTNDHTVVGDLLRMHVLTPEQVRTHARRSILTRAIGLALFIQPEISSIELYDNDRLILCSDGAWSSVQDEELGRLAHHETDMEKLSKNIINLALEHGSDDNLSVVSIHLQTLGSMPKNGKVKRGWLERIFPGPLQKNDRME